MNEHSKRHIKRIGLLSGLLLAGALVFGSMGGCRDLQKRRVELKTAGGADSGIDGRFGLTADAQDPSERDKELGYGRWKAKPDPEGTASPTDPARRKP